MLMKILILDTKHKFTKAMKPYTEMEVATEEREKLPAKFWGKHVKVNPGTIVEIEANKEIFNDKPQLTMEGYYKEIKEDPISFLPKYPDRTITDAKKKIVAGIKSIDNPDVAHVVKYVIKDRMMLFMQSPAGLYHHHDKIGGLAVHTAEVLDLSLKMAEMYSLKQNDKDIVIGGAVLHDIGKIEEYKITYKIEARESGFLLGHINIGVAYLEAYMRNYQMAEAALHLQHVIAAHHGRLEWGSAVKPKTIPAQIVYLADFASTNCDKAIKNLDSVIL